MRSRSTLLITLILFVFSAGVHAKEQWVTVRSDNFHLIGNGDRAEISDVAKRLEQFREVFGFLFPNIQLQEAVETKVIVFRDQATFRPFLPKKQDGTPDDGIGGYFLTAESANYIALTTGFGKKTTYETIFHEYVHYLLNNNFGRADIPPWLNEGLAEYYSTIEIKDGGKVYLGNLRQDHLYFLQRNELMPLKEFFAVDNFALHQNGDHSRTIFYAQAWALIHYLSSKQKLEKLGVLVNAANDGRNAEKAFQRAFGMDYEEMEVVLTNYVKQNKFQRMIANVETTTVNEKTLKVSNLDEADALADLGSLLYHRGDLKDAEFYLGQSLSLDKSQPLANTSMGLLKLQQDKHIEAEKYLETAIQSQNADYYVQFGYAYVLSRGPMDKNGFVMGYEPKLARKMRRAINRAIELKPEFVPSYNLLAFINLATGENLQESVGFLKKVLSLQPGNETASLTLAQVYMRLNRLDDAERLATKVFSTTADKAQRDTAETVLKNVKRFRDVESRNKELLDSRKGLDNGDATFAIVRNDLTDEEVIKISREREISLMNESILQPKKGEQRVIGFVRSVVCDGRKITYRIEKAGGGNMILRSDGFRGIELRSLTAEAGNAKFNCGNKFASIKAVVHYQPAARSTGTVKAISFVPKFFRFKTKREIERDTRVVILKSTERDSKGTAIEVRDISAEETPEEAAERRRLNQIFRITASLRKPRAGEMRRMGRIKQISCVSETMTFHIQTSSGKKAFVTDNPRGLDLMIYGQDPGSVRIGCGLEPPTAPVVMTYKADNKSDIEGTVVYMEFVVDGVTID